MSCGQWYQLSVSISTSAGLDALHGSFECFPHFVRGEAGGAAAPPPLGLHPVDVPHADPRPLAVQADGPLGVVLGRGEVVVLHLHEVHLVHVLHNEGPGARGRNEGIHEGL